MALLGLDSYYGCHSDFLIASINNYGGFMLSGVMYGFGRSVPIMFHRLSGIIHFFACSLSELGFFLRTEVRRTCTNAHELM